MGKIDDMRRQREQQFADLEQRQAKAAKARPVDAVVAPVAPARTAAPFSAAAVEADAKKRTSSKSRDAVNEQGKCPDCGKMKPVSNGLMANHQKGFGKACPGSRKKPV